jgi:hypothetical protein
LNRKLVVGALAVFSAVASLLYVGSLMNQSLVFRFDKRELNVKNISWNMPLARAEFNLTANLNYGDAIRIQSVKVDGSIVDFYPETLFIGDGETVVVRVYFSYCYSTRYEFEFIDFDGSIFTINATSPSD